MSAVLDLLAFVAFLGALGVLAGVLAIVGDLFGGDS